MSSVAQVRTHSHQGDGTVIQSKVVADRLMAQPHAAMRQAVVAHQVEKRFGEVLAVENASFSIEPGSFIAATPGDQRTWMELLFLSFTTLSGVGLSDILPVLPMARARVTPGFGVGVKLNSADFQKGGFDAEDAAAVVRLLNEEAVDLVEISGGSYESPAMHGRPVSHDCRPSCARAGSCPR